MQNILKLQPSLALQVLGFHTSSIALFMAVDPEWWDFRANINIAFPSCRGKLGVIGKVTAALGHGFDWVAFLISLNMRGRY